MRLQQQQQPAGFRELRRRCDLMSSSVLAERLRELREAQIVSVFRDTDRYCTPGQPYSGSVSQPVTWGPPRPERADAARNRRVLLATARQMLAEQAADRLTMDALAERAGVGKGTVFRRFRSRAGIFHALLDDDERAFQEQVLSGSPPLGPGAGPLDRLIAYGRARIGFLIEHREIARAALDGRETVPAGSQSPMSREHVRYLLSQLSLDAADLDVLATQLTAALDSPPLLYLSSDMLTRAAPQVRERLGCGWEDLIRRVCQSPAAFRPPCA